MTHLGPQGAAGPAAVCSILFEKPDRGIPRETAEAPVFFVDLNLDQVVDTITAAKEEYDLKPFFYTSLNEIDAITYRHDVMRDLEHPRLLAHVEAFARGMRAMREHLAQADKLYYKYQKEVWFLDAVAIYVEAVSGLRVDLSGVDLGSRGFVAFRDYLSHYADSDDFTSLVAEMKQLRADLAAITYALLIKENSITVRGYEAEGDFSAAVEETFKKFQQGAVKDYRVGFPTGPEMNHVEAQILDRVALLNPDVFSRLDRYCVAHAAYLDHTIAVFDREIQFYLAYLEYVAIFRKAGLRFCYPRISDASKEVYDSEAFDLALAQRLVHDGAPVVTNDFRLSGGERVLVVSGPNQGGKTTFARTFGQLHYLASLGCPVPGREAQLFLFDRLFTHFEKEEHIRDLRGKLEDDLIRVHEILERATPRSIIILNEIFTATTLRDAVFLGKQMMGRIIRLDALCVCVTFLVELASLAESTVSMVSTVVPDNPAVRTYKVVRRPADGLAYAISIAEKYRVTYAALGERIAR
jgi:hypothetical protein